MIQKNLVCLLAVIIFPLFLYAQKITYSQPEKDDVRSVEFDIIGKIDNNYLVYKRIRNTYAISIYDNEMKLADKITMDFLPDKYYFYFIYQYQKRNVVYCAAAKIDGSGKLMNDPVTLDTTAISFFASNKIYNVLYSEDKERLCI